MKKRSVILLVIIFLAVFAIAGCKMPSIGAGPSSCQLAPEEWRPAEGDCPSSNAETQAKCEEFCVKHPDCCRDRQEGQEGMQAQGTSCSLVAGEWLPQQGECPGKTPEMQTRCNDFCDKHPDCCGQRQGSRDMQQGNTALFKTPSDSEIAALKRNYPATIKAINEGPAIYGAQDGYDPLTDEKLEDMKAAGFNTVQLLTISDFKDGKYYIDSSSKVFLLNNIILAKKHGMAVWIALEYVNAPPGSGLKFPAYDEFKPAYLQFSRENGELFEKYQVEYITVNNEPDLFFREQTHFGNEQEIDAKVAEMLPSSNTAVKEKFRGKVINKVTQTRKRSQAILDASFKNADIASVDVGPPVSDQTSMDIYKSDFDDYQQYASLAEKAGVPWMVGEYWQYNYFEQPSNYAKENQVALAKVSFDAYLKVQPKGVGYSWNDYSSFSQPRGQETKQAIKEFFEKI